MKHRIRKCVKCGRYTLKDRCPLCGSETVSPHPARFSPEDRYVKYRVRALHLVSKDREEMVDRRESGGSASENK